MDDTSKERLLEDGDNEDNDSVYDDPPHNYCSPRMPFWQNAFLYLLMLNCIVILYWMLSPGKLQPNTLYEPAQDAIRYTKQRIYRPLPGNVYAGEPRPELDDAWRELIKPMGQKLTKDEAQKLGADTIAFKDGTGYIAEMAVFHELHCIKRIKQHLSPSHYHPNMTGEEAEKEEIHIDHCLEYLRRAAMCRGDTSLATFFWQDGKPKTRNWSDHVCVDWDKLYGFALEHSVLVDDASVLEGPKDS